MVMLTGDNRRTAEAVRKRLDIEEVVAEVLPQDKEKKVSGLKAEGHKVAMIGDGIDFAPASRRPSTAVRVPGEMSGAFPADTPSEERLATDTGPSPSGTISCGAMSSGLSAWRTK